MPDIAWITAEREPRRLDPRLLILLREIRSRSTLRAAVAGAGLSYRGAWDLLGSQARALGAPLVVLQRGKGARLAPLAEELLAADERARKMLQASREELAVRVQSARRTASLRCVASHDLLLAEFTKTAGLPLELSFRGSLDSVAALAHGEADLAGFHLSPGAPAGAMPYLRLLKARRDRLVRFAAREQGLIVAAGNPKKVHSLAQVAGRHLRFVNRQRGSGTRALVDELLRKASVAPAELRGYADEEFTHAAVAATVAAGRADSGVGVRAAATRFGLGFVPLKREHYWLAAHERTLASPAGERILAALRTPSFERTAARLTGYDVAGAGEVVALSVLRSDRT
ncbi:MAG TPA: substrate-binding domain-containing protein [Burkholderiales bacterium]|nr:substrate-binding domain-containing protein [Burkholderiales bacterium]